MTEGPKPSLGDVVEMTAPKGSGVADGEPSGCGTPGNGTQYAGRVGEGLLMIVGIFGGVL